MVLLQGDQDQKYKSELCTKLRFVLLDPGPGWLVPFISTSINPRATELFGDNLNLLLFKSGYSIINDIYQLLLQPFILNNPMYISVTNPSTDQKLDYQFYFLLRTFRWKEDEYIADMAKKRLLLQLLVHGKESVHSTRATIHNQ